MLVKEIIKELQKFDGETIVRFVDDFGQENIINSVYKSSFGEVIIIDTRTLEYAARRKDSLFFKKE